MTQRDLGCLMPRCAGPGNAVDGGTAIEIMFEHLAAGGDGLVAIVASATREEPAAAARRFAAMAELLARHAQGRTDRARWSCDNRHAIAAQVALRPQPRPRLRRPSTSRTRSPDSSDQPTSI